MFRSHSTPLWHGHMLSGMHCKFLIGKCPLRFPYISCLNGKLYSLYLWVVLALRWRTAMYAQKGRFLSLTFSQFSLCCSEWKISSYASILGCRHIWCCPGHVVATCFSVWVRWTALTEPVNQSHSLANKDWSHSGLMVAGWWDSGLRFEWDDIRQIHST